MTGAPGFVKIHRSMLDWEWYNDDATLRVFLHLLLTANWEEKKWRGEVIKPGQQITSMEAIALQLDVSRATVRRCIDKLKSTGEVAIQTNNHWTAITLVNWAKYQGDDKPTNQPAADQRPTDAMTNGRPVSQPAATTKEEKKVRTEEGKNYSQLPLPGITEKEPSAFGDPSINELMAFLKAENGNLMDGSVKNNRYACATLIKKARAAKPDADPVAGIKHLIREGKKVHFHGPKITSFTYLLDHTTEIANLIRSGNNGNGKQQSPEDKREAVRRAVLEQQGG